MPKCSRRGSWRRMHRAYSPLVAHDSPPQALGAPDARAQAPQLDDLAVIDKEIDFGTIVFDVPSEDFGIGRLEHHALQPQGGNDPRHDVGPPSADVFGDAFRLDHDHRGASLEKAAGLANRPL